MKRGQMKVQEMAFVLVALMIFFALVALLYLSVRGSSLDQQARGVSDERAQEAARILASTPMFAWSECKGCVDLDKAFVLSQQRERNISVPALAEYDYLAFEVIYPGRAGGVCTPSTYPACNQTIVIPGKQGYGVAQSAFVTLCHWDPEVQMICELGKVYVSDRGRERATS